MYHESRFFRMRQTFVSDDMRTLGANLPARLQPEMEGIMQPVCIESNE